eukprot:gnl/TRDRNA2_/TRDRNA2_40796_c0_seq1.p1 gnl/TRDRNA2_/TRDRNA2_40796_c0~~gnl/TRDRNA2_/TRDRNA2_40796_c0_seq1.p1  ORF type:complete len:471 (-),score=102.45 gnl/TRDRNA2_/TRDRNA2_40796_c0_seq1:73-1374(-)
MVNPMVNGMVAGAAAMVPKMSSSPQMVVRPKMPLFERGTLPGRITVEQPETTGNPMAMHTTYLVLGNLGDLQFSARKRYSDFEWFRKVLVAHFPGILIPQIPKKQMIGRFDEAFIETRRVGLEEFLCRLACKPQIAQSKLLQTFLKRPMEGLEDLKAELERLPVAILCREFKAAFANELPALQAVAGDGSQLDHCRNFLESHVAQLKELSNELGTAVDSQRAATAASAASQQMLAGFYCTDVPNNGLMPGAGESATEQHRVELISAFRQQQPSLDDASCLHFEMLQASVDRELDDAEAMQEALSSLENLQQSVFDARARVEMDATALRQLQAEMQAPRPNQSSGVVSGLLSYIISDKDLPEQEAERRQQLEHLKIEVAMGEEWYVAARTVTVGLQVEAFAYEKAALHKWSKEQFMQKSHETLRFLNELWGGHR